MAQANLPSDKLQLSNEHNRRSFFNLDNSFFWLLPAFGLLLFYSIFPLLYNLYLSFNEWNIMAKEFRSVGGENWAIIWNSLFNQSNSLADPRILNSLFITFQYVIYALIIQLLLGFIIALLLDAGPWGANIWQSLMILPMVIAPAVAGMMYRLLLHSEFGAISWLFYSLGIMTADEPFMGGTGQYALFALLIVEVWQWTPFFVIILLAGMKGLPVEIMEAASVDGANWFQRLFQIKIPLLRGVLLIAILFRLIDLYRVYDYVHIMTSGGPGNRTLTLSYYTAVTMFNQLKWGYGATLSVFILIIAWITAFVYQKFFRIEW